MNEREFPVTTKENVEDLCFKLTKERMQKFNGLCYDVENMFQLLLLNAQGNCKNLEPLPEYEEFVRETYKLNQEMADFILENSDPQSVEKLNVIIRDFN